jgi:hypothetical protein
MKWVLTFAYKKPKMITQKDNKKKLLRVQERSNDMTSKTDASSLQVEKSSIVDNIDDFIDDRNEDLSDGGFYFPKRD